MSLLLCRREKVKHPFYIEVLGIHIYSSQELCYVIYHHPLLVMNDFVDASLFFFVKNELGLGFLAGRMEKLVEAGGRPEEALYLFLSECDYYTEKEIQKFKQVTASYRNLSQNAYGKAVADYLFSQKQYGKALQKYEKLTEEGERKKGEEAFWSQVYQNLGAACAQMFQFSRAYKAYDTAYGLKEEDQILEKIYFLTCFAPGLSIDESYEALFKPEWKEEWKGKLETVSKATVASREDLALAYTPGVAEPCKVIAKDPEAAYLYTIKSNTIAVVSDGSAVLGLGNIGPLAAMPVMEGKAVLFKLSLIHI